MLRRAGSLPGAALREVLSTHAPAVVAQVKVPQSVDAPSLLVVGCDDDAAGVDCGSVGCGGGGDGGDGGGGAVAATAAAVPGGGAVVADACTRSLRRSARTLNGEAFAVTLAYANHSSAAAATDGHNIAPDVAAWLARAASTAASCPPHEWKSPPAIQCCLCAASSPASTPATSCTSIRTCSLPFSPVPGSPIAALRRGWGGGARTAMADTGYRAHATTWPAAVAGGAEGGGTTFASGAAAATAPTFALLPLPQQLLVTQPSRLAPQPPQSPREERRHRPRPRRRMR